MLSVQGATDSELNAVNLDFNPDGVIPDEEEDPVLGTRLSRKF
jgi:hypothetical protein